MRNSKQRELILDIINSAYTHPTAEEIYEIAINTIPNISLGTVYRNLDVLYSDGSIRRINLENNTYRYDRAMDSHAHFVCNECHSITDIPQEIFQNLNEISGNRVITCDIIFKGICKNCLKKGGY